MRANHQEFGRRSSGTGFVITDAKLTAVVTRFRVKTAYALFKFYLDFRRVHRECRKIDGFVSAAFAIEDCRTCYTLSFWRDSQALLEFNTKVVSHIQVANQSFKHLKRSGGRSELWSGEFELAYRSKNFRWPAAKSTCIPKSLDAEQVQTPSKATGQDS